MKVGNYYFVGGVAGIRIPLLVMGVGCVQEYSQLQHMQAYICHEGNKRMVEF